MDHGEGENPNEQETFGDKFTEKAIISEKTRANKDLNPQNLSLKDKLKRIGLGALVGLTIGGGVAATRTVEQNSQDPLYGQAVNGEVQKANLISSSEFKTNVSDLNPSAPIFRKSPDQYSDEYSKEQLEEMGVNVTGDIEIEKVWGKPYASNLKSAEVVDEKSGITHGVWGEIVAPDPENPGKYKGTGVYLSENFFRIDQPENTSTNSNEGQNLNQEPTTSSSQEQH